MTQLPEPPRDDLGFQLPAVAPSHGQSRAGVIVVLVLLVGGALAFGFLRKRDVTDVAIPGAAAARVPRVVLVTPRLVSTNQAVVLPSTVKPLEETQLYARVTGYLRSWKADIGDKVAAGQLLAEIDAPDLQAQLVQARAQLASAQASVKQSLAQREYSKANANRTAALADQQLIAKAQQEQTQAQAATDEASVNAARANVAAQEANVHRLEELVAFTKVTAPFAGTITMRGVDRGALVKDGGTLLFTLVATDPVRVYIDVPQSIAPSVRAGADAMVTAREYGGRKFPGKVTRAAGALDADIHTMRTEIQVPNPDGALLPGMFVTTAIQLPVPHKVVEIPATALYNDAEGLRVATVDQHGVAKLVKIQIERDTGPTLHIGVGLTGEERIIETVVPWLADGDRVDVVSVNTKWGPPGAGSAKPAAGSGSAAGSAAGSGSGAAK